MDACDLINQYCVQGGVPAFIDLAVQLHHKFPKDCTMHAPGAAFSRLQIAIIGEGTCPVRDIVIIITIPIIIIKKIVLVILRLEASIINSGS